ncbi:MAG: 2Fe-2S iron-sulfur cluster binding domain-containing protein [Moraxellaceae bacterium]|jgi:ferredoxin-NADP reductase|nr:MAG: 2Fe-2S iron-sulfur cluster binding domain-containing protein [Moraxellaceae bacterium]
MLQANTYKPHWIREDFVDFVLGKVNPLWTLRRTMARIENIESIADDMIKVTLVSNNKFSQYKPGQFVMVTVRIDGVQHQRAYSLVSSPDDSHLVLGIKKQGRVSNYLASQAHRGDVIEITPAMGEFVLKNTDQPILLVSAGSGITPMIPLAKQALSRSKQPVTLIYYSRDPAFRAELEQLAAQYAHFDLHIIVDSAAKPAFFDEETLDRLCPDAAKRHTYVCAAPGLMKATRQIWNKRGWNEQITQESFLPVTISDDAQAVPVNFRRSMQSFEGRGNLLASAEAAGLKPAYGCRMGICNTCSCTKVSGAVRNQLTGEINDQNNVQIKLCVSEAVSPVEIDL